ncbi:MAG: MiaB/RimO family radical SAM methylthiotransferase, partial [Phycisphaerales bacterium]|nr:MiaB/RimO family radical SAM methylthiotransferase [Phycisphaerales bacterium]
DAMVGVFDRDHIVEAVQGSAPVREAPDGPPYWIAANALAAAKARGMATTGLTVNGQDAKGVGYFESDASRMRLTPRHYAYLRMSEGCNQNCAFCTIPSIRGKMRSKPLDAIVREARELVLDGAFELLLIGQDTTSYGDDIGIGMRDDGTGGLPDLLRSLSDTVQEASGKGWIRLMYAYPTKFDDRIIDAFVELTQSGHLTPYLDIPLQHASDDMLRAMRRNVTSDVQEDLIERLRERVPGMAIRTTFITGFPGETEEDHEDLLAFIERMQFDAMGVFEYSPEDGTVAGRLDRDPDLHVDAETKRRRHDELMALQQEIAFEQAEFLASHFDGRDPATGMQFDVLIDRPAEDGLAQGRAYFQAPDIDSVTSVQSRQRLVPGELVRCVITEADGYDLVARPVDEVGRLSLPIR